MFRTGIDFIILDHSCDACVPLTPSSVSLQKHHTQTHPPKNKATVFAILAGFQNFGSNIGLQGIRGGKGFGGPTADCQGGWKIFLLLVKFLKLLLMVQKSGVHQLIW